MNAKGGYVYIMSNKSRTILYIGVTSNLIARVAEHRQRTTEGFTYNYNCIYLILFHDSIETAIEREKQLKRWKRSWKENLIKSINPQLKDLRNTIDGCD